MRLKIIKTNDLIPEIGKSFNDMRKDGTIYKNKFLFLFLINYTLIYRYFKNKIIKFVRFRIFFQRLEYLLFNFSLNLYDKKNNFKYLKGVFKTRKLHLLKENLLEKKHFKNVYDIGNVIPRINISNYSNVWNFENDILSEDIIFELFSNQKIIKACKSVIGRNACISSIWAWHSNNKNNIAYNQRWHRDLSEPLNFIRVFIPLTPIRYKNDGATKVILESELTDKLFSIGTRYDDSDVNIFPSSNFKEVLAEVGDVYFLNTLAIHKGTLPQISGKRSMLSILVSLAPSHRSYCIPRRHIQTFEKNLQNKILENKNWFKYLVKL